MIKHIVCFKFKNEVNQNSIFQISELFFSLVVKIPEILNMEGGENNSPEGLNKEFSHCFIISFKNEDARRNYLPHPEHKKFVNVIKPLIEDVFVIDFDSQ